MARLIHPKWMISLQNSILEKRSRRGKPLETKPSELRNASNAMMIQKHTPECAPVSGNFSMISKAHEIEVLAALRRSLPVSLQRAGKRVLVLTQKAVLYVCVDSMQPLLGALGFLLISGGLRL